jgi:hypothetical protein
MPKKTKKHAHFTDEEKNMVNEIVTVCVARMYHFIRIHNNPKQYADKILKISDSKKSFVLAYYILGAINMLPEQFFFSKDENEKLAREISREIPHMVEINTDTILDLARESRPYLKSWEMTEVSQKLSEEGLFMNIRGKKGIKQHAPHALPRLRKWAGYEMSKRKGYYSVYKITEDLTTLNKVISNPKVMQHIYTKLKDYGMLKKFYLFNGLAVMYALRDGDENMFRLATVGAQQILKNNPKAQAALEKTGLDNKKIQHSAWGQIRNYLLSLSEEKLGKLVEEMVDYLIKNPIDRSIFLLALSSL